MSLLSSRWLWALGLTLAIAVPARAQYGVATLTHADGGVTRQHRGAPAATTIGVSIMDGDRIETANGRAEVAFLDGTLIHLDRDSAVVVLAGDRLRMVSGRVSLRTSGTRSYVAEAAGSKIHVNPTTAIEISAQAGRQDATVRVVSGKTRVESSKGSSVVPDYHRVYLAGPTSGPAVTKVMPDPADEFERWALTRLVLASSTPLKGTEHGGGVAYSPYGYYGYGLDRYSAPYSYSGYATYSHTRYYYPVTPYYSSYAAPIYTYSSPYYGSPYYMSSNPYYAPAIYSTNYYSASTYSATPSTSSFAPAATAPATGPSAVKGVPVPKP